MTVTATPLPTISEAGKKKLDELLDAKVAEATIPGIFFGATNAEGEIYFNAKGDKVLGHPEKGQINENTSEWRRGHATVGRPRAMVPSSRAWLLTVSGPALLADQVHHLARLPPALGEGTARL